MGQKIPPEQIKLYKAIDDILWCEWDPIGISNTGCPRDEYHAYLPRVFSIAMGTNDPQMIWDYLEWVVVKRMGLESNMGQSIDIARRVLTKKKEYGL